MMKNGKWAVRGTSPITGVKVFRFVGNKKPTVSAEKTVESQKAEKEVVSRYYKSHEQDSPKVEKPKSDKCPKCGSKIAADEMFCTGCGTKR
jgi:hypothetical protein